mmetsp:Transcript_20472/g.44528  ORF Transcript_20472/g.44528 Transcript_20472/m.44528 type:complete len:473 (-) Transcript_20472:36-1454(-)
MAEVGTNIEDATSVEERVAPMTSTVKVRTYKRRWAMLTLFCLGTAANAILWITFSPINSLAGDYYGVSSTDINVLSIVFLAAYVPVSILANYINNKLGLRVVIIIGCVLNILSGLLHWVSCDSNSESRNHGYAICLTGQILGAIAQPFFTNMPTTIAASWFPKDERDIATAIGSLFNPIGMAVGTILPSLYVVGDNVSVSMKDLMLMEFIIMIATSVIIILLFRGKPEIPPSVSEQSKINNKSRLREDFVSLAKNRNFVILTVCFGTGLGFFNALLTVFEQLVKKSNYTTDDATLFQSVLLGCGIVFAIVAALILDRVHCYNLFLKVGFALAGVCAYVFVFVIRPENTAAIAILSGLLGAMMLPQLPIAFECGVECTYPINEDLSTGVLMCAGQLTGVFFILVIGALLNNQGDYSGTYVVEPAYILILVFVALFVVGIQFYYGDYRRQHAEKGTSDILENNQDCEEQKLSQT